MVIIYNLIIAFFIIVSIIVLDLGTALYFLSSWCADKVDFRVIQDLLLFVIGQLILEVDEGLLRRHGELGHLLLVLWRGLRFEGECGANDFRARVRAIAVGPLI